MSEQVFWVWNSWALAACAGIAAWVVLHGLVSAVARSFFFLRHPLALFLGIPSVIAGFVLGSWAAGLLNLLVGPLLGILVMRVVFILTGRT